MLQSLPGRGKFVVLLAVLGALLVPQAANAEITEVLGITCTGQPDGVRFCNEAPRSTVDSWDGTPIDVNVAFPPEPVSGPDGNYPLVMMFHGYGGVKAGLSEMRRWLSRGYATFSMQARGFRESCGSPASKLAAGAACDDGYVRLIDNRYEVRDAQTIVGELADEPGGLINPQKLGSIGGSYGGGMSMALGALKNRVVMPDYSLVPWQSPAGKPMQIAAAAPAIPWTDLAYSLAPNGGTLDYVADAPYRGVVGVMKQSLVEGLYFSGQAAPGFYAPEGSDPTADLTGWRARLTQGEPYGAEGQAIIDEITQHHSSYYIDHSIPPAPLLMSSGFTDDLFPADETIRFYNRTKTEYPDADLGLFFGDFGHPRSQNGKDATAAALREKEHAWFDFYLKGEGSEPTQGVDAYTQTCPSDAPEAGPYTAPNWAQVAPGEIRYADPELKTIAADSTTAGQFNPVTSNACTKAPSEDRPGAAVYRLDAAPAEGFTLLGSVSVIAEFGLATDTSQVAARLLDVAPDGTQTLVNRGLWRPENGSGKQVFQLHPNGWRFEAGHVPKLELLAQDAGGAPLLNYGRPSNGQGPVTVSNLKMRLPVAEKPGSLDGLVGTPAPKVLTEGYELAADFAALGKPKPKVKGKRLEVKGNKVLVPLACPPSFVACHDLEVDLTAKGKAKGKSRAKNGKKYAVASGGLAELAGGTRKTVKLKLSGKARKALAKKPKLNVRTAVRSIETTNAHRGKAKLKAKKK